MLIGVGVICFVASYVIVLALEISRLYFGHSVRNILMSLFAWAGFLAHSAYIFHQQMAIDSGQLVNNVQGFFFVVAWGLVVFYLYLSYTFPKTPFGLVLLPLTLLLLAGGLFLGDTTPFATETAFTAHLFWRRLHGIAFMAATLSMLFGLVCGVLYFVHEKRLKKRKAKASGRFRWPSLEWLANTVFRCVGLTIMFLGVGIFSGYLTGFLNDRSPVRFDSAVMLLYLLVYIALLVFGPKMMGERKHFSILTIVTFIFLVGIFVMLSDTEHFHRETEAGMERSAMTVFPPPTRAKWPPTVAHRVAGGVTPGPERRPMTPPPTVAHNAWDLCATVGGGGINHLREPGVCTPGYPVGHHWRPFAPVGGGKRPAGGAP